MTRHETGGLGCEENCGAGKLIWLTEPPHRGAHEQFTSAIRAVEESFIQRRAEYAWQDRVDANAVGCPLHSQGFGEGGDTRLARPIGRDFLECDERGERSNVDDATITFLDH